MSEFAGLANRIPHPSPRSAGLVLATRRAGGAMPAVACADAQLFTVRVAAALSGRGMCGFTICSYH